MIIAFVIFKCKKVFFSILVDNPNYFKQIFTCITKYRCSVSLGENEKKTKIFKRLLQTYILSFCIYGYADKKTYSTYHVWFMFIVSSSSFTANYTSTSAVKSNTTFSLCISLLTFSKQQLKSNRNLSM
jgi:ABC-type multidrug transport system permease subunit